MTFLYLPSSHIIYKKNNNKMGFRCTFPWFFFSANKSEAFRSRSKHIKMQPCCPCPALTGVHPPALRRLSLVTVREGKTWPQLPSSFLFLHLSLYSNLPSLIRGRSENVCTPDSQESFRQLEAWGLSLLPQALLGNRLGIFTRNPFNIANIFLSS